MPSRSRAARHSSPSTFLGMATHHLGRSGRSGPRFTRTPAAHSSKVPREPICAIPVEIVLLFRRHHHPGQPSRFRTAPPVRPAHPGTRYVPTSNANVAHRPASETTKIPSRSLHSRLPVHPVRYRDSSSIPASFPFVPVFAHHPLTSPNISRPSSLETTVYSPRYAQHALALPQHSLLSMYLPFSLVPPLVYPSRTRVILPTPSSLRSDLLVLLHPSLFLPLFAGTMPVHMFGVRSSWPCPSARRQVAHSVFAPGGHPTCVCQFGYFAGTMPG